ncbi:hypothetical protein MET9862_05622 [Methylobacterium symbioticum]|uniref:Flagellar hook-length control protein-like C-terminal domain-containing protein n=1 Tax=Methylobacterium symbioticum TaxID=2584084 RepID=A0A509ENJ6_9HYPH|nr:hypothetical protein MET9862_05622 [Methylobacterium symbioticum]
MAAEAPAAASAQMAGQAAGHGQAEGPLRLLTLQLHPADLGAVVVRMRLQDGRLEMNLQASREETADLLRKDREALGELLRGAGYRPDIVTIQSGPADQQGPGSRGQGAFQGPETGAGGAGSGSGAERGPGDQPGRRGAVTPDDPARSRDQGHETASGEPRGGVYL